MVESMLLKLPDGRIIQGSVDEILSFLSNYSNGRPVVSRELVDDFIIWLKRRGLTVRTIREYAGAVEKFVGLSLDEINPKSSTQVKALRNYVAFLWERGVIAYDEYLRFRARFRVSGKSSQRYYSIDSGTARLLRDEAFRRRGRTGLVLRLLYYSGARASEPVYMIRNWRPGEEVVLPGGFISKRLVCLGSHCRYYLGWKRGRKNCEWIFFPRELLDEIKLFVGSPPSYEYVRVLRNKLGFPVKLYRKYFYNVCVKATGKPELCAFIESRTGGVSREHYMDVLRFTDELYPVVLKALDKASY